MKFLAKKSIAGKITFHVSEHFVVYEFGCSEKLLTSVNFSTQQICRHVLIPFDSKDIINLEMDEVSKQNAIQLSIISFNTL